MSSIIYELFFSYFMNFFFRVNELKIKIGGVNPNYLLFQSKRYERLSLPYEIICVCLMKVLSSTKASVMKVFFYLMKSLSTAKANVMKDYPCLMKSLSSAKANVMKAFFCLMKSLSSVMKVPSERQRAL